MPYIENKYVIEKQRLKIPKEYLNAVIIRTEI
jgi:hypothetical protein